MAAFMAVTLLATLLAPEPARGERQPTSWRALLSDGVVGPFRDFFARYAGWLGVALLLFVGLIKVPDQLLGVMAIPFYLDSGFSKTEIAAVSKVFGVWMGIAGAFLGGAAVVRLGVTRALLMAIVIGAASNLLFVLLARFPGDLSLFTLVIAGENAAGGFLGGELLTVGEVRRPADDQGLGGAELLDVVGHHLLQEAAAEILGGDRAPVDMPGLLTAHLPLELSEHVVVAHADEPLGFLAADHDAVRLDLDDRRRELFAVAVARAFGQTRDVEACHHGGAGTEVDADDICHETDYKTPA